MKQSRRSLEWIESTMNCKECPLAGFQTPPIPFAGPIFAPVLVLGQNPGQIRQYDHERLELAKDMMAETDPIRYKELYWQDFVTSSGYERLASLFGDKWLETNRFCYSNVVLCRTKGNSKPSEAFAKSCWDSNVSHLVKIWSESGDRGKLAVLMGRIAGQWESEIRRFGVDVLAIPHYVTWNDQIMGILEEKWTSAIATIKW